MDKLLVGGCCTDHNIRMDLCIDCQKNINRHLSKRIIELEQALNEIACLHENGGGSDVYYAVGNIINEVIGG